LACDIKIKSSRFAYEKNNEQNTYSQTVSSTFRYKNQNMPSNNVSNVAENYLVIVATKITKFLKNADHSQKL